MDHHLEDSLNLDSTIGVDFEQPEDIAVSEAAMSLGPSSHDDGIAMEFEHTEEQPILMDTSNEEIIVSELMGDQFTLQEYTVPADPNTGLTTTVETSHSLASQSETMVDIQFQPQLVSAVKTEMMPPKLIAIKSIPTIRPIGRKSETVVAPAPRQIAIAPKPPRLVTTKTYAPPKQLPIAPKPLIMPANRGHSLVKKVSIANVVQGANKTNTVLAQIGKQLIMMPAGAQKIKLVSPTGPPNVQYIRADPDQAQLVANKNVSGTQNKPIMTKIYAVQGKPKIDPLSQPAVITKILPVGKVPSQQRFVALPPKSMPIAFGNKVLMAAPKQGLVKLTKKQEIITIKSPTAKLLPAPALVPVSTGSIKNKVILTNTTKNILFKPTTTIKPVEVVGDTAVLEKQTSQLHQIRVPGKGIQYVRLFTNPTSTPKAAAQPKPANVASNSKTFVITDSKGNIIQMTAEKMAPGQPPALVMSSNSNTITTVTKPQHKLVRIAPIAPKTTQATSQPGRSSHSLLAPLSPIQTTVAESILPDIEPLAVPDLVEVTAAAEVEAALEAEDIAEEQEEVDSKSALRRLIENAVSEDEQSDVNEVEIEFKQQPQSPEQDNSMDSMEQHDSSSQSEEQNLIVIPSKYPNLQPDAPTGDQKLDDSQPMDNVINLDDDMNNSYQSTNALTEATDAVPTDFGLRPRKACNCTKSQCLKLYCDCFANGEFCNRCNCVNCLNNLDNEELRQKAIRGCLDRNPNAFRPKIGKSKTGGPEIIRRHNKGCNCKRSGCLKNYCECYEAKIACTPICKCVGCRNVEETLARRHRSHHLPRILPAPPPAPLTAPKQPCSFMTTEVIEAVCQCLLAAAVENKESDAREPDPMRDVIEEFARCLQDIISAAHQSSPAALMEETA